MYDTYNCLGGHIVTKLKHTNIAPISSSSNYQKFTVSTSKRIWGIKGGKEEILTADHTESGRY